MMLVLYMFKSVFMLNDSYFWPLILAGCMSVTNGQTDHAMKTSCNSQPASSMLPVMLNVPNLS